MGEIAEQMINGDMCQWCGEILESGAGYPRICQGCQNEHGVDEHGWPVEKIPKKKKCRCRVCGKSVKKAGLQMHMQAKHGDHQDAYSSKKVRLKRIAQIIDEVQSDHDGMVGRVRMLTADEVAEIYSLAIGRSIHE